MTVVPLRKTFTLGGSDAAAAAGIDPYLSRVMLWAEKTGRVQREETEAMLWGKMLEPVIVDVLAEQGYEPGRYPHPEPVGDATRSWLRGHPDGFCVLRGAAAVLEVKTANAWATRGDRPPVQYEAQCQVYMHLTDLPRALLATLVGGQRLVTHTIERDRHATDLLLERMEDFLGFLERDEPPPPDASPSARDALLALYPQAQEGRRVRLTHRQMGLYRTLRARREQEAAVREQRLQLENDLKALMGDAEEAVSPSDETLIRWTNTTRSAVDVARLKAERPDVHAAFLTTTETRRFTVA
jgi:putative phage-type endonuclease